jgi:hypothetical protein
VTWIGEEELEELLAPEPARLVDPDSPRRMRFALSGSRHELALALDEASGRWAWPQPGVPSTHIVKPATDGRPGLLVNEVACTTACREIGLPVAHAELATIAGHRCVVSKRFDRWVGGHRTERLHQESLSQALGVAPPGGHEGSGRPEHPTLAESSELLREACDEGDAMTLMLVSVCNTVLGNCDSHGPNCALLHDGTGPLLAPIYDIASTEPYGDRPPRRRLADAELPPAPLLVDFVAIADECGFAFQPALIAAAGTMTRFTVALGRVVERAHAEGWYEPVVDEALHRVAERVLGFREEIEYLRPRGC